MSNDKPGSLAELYKQRVAQAERAQVQVGDDFDLGAIERATQAALTIVDRDEADKLIGDLGRATDKTLLDGVIAQHQLFFALLVRLHGLDPLPPVVDLLVKHQGVMLQLIHNAYAVGKRDGMAYK